MNEEIFKNTINGEEGTKKEGAGDAPENTYERYKSLGGIINEKDYQSALDRAKHTTTFDLTLITQTETVARAGGILLHNAENSLDPRTILYGILRRDTNPEAKYHHSSMSDQRLFAEVLRMLGDTDSLQKLIQAHSHISF